MSDTMSDEPIPLYAELADRMCEAVLDIAQGHDTNTILKALMVTAAVLMGVRCPDEDEGGQIMRASRMFDEWALEILKDP